MSEKAKVIQRPTSDILERIKSSQNSAHPGTGGDGRTRQNRNQVRPNRDQAPGAGLPVLPLPESVNRLCNNGGCENFGLLFHRFLPYSHVGGKEYSLDKEVPKKLEQDAERIFSSDVNQNVIDALNERHERLKQNCANAVTFSGTVAWRLAVGLGNEHPMENGLTLHRIYGIPYLPATTIKGVTRSWKLGKIAESLNISPCTDSGEIKQLKEKNKKTPWQMMEELLWATVPAEKSSKEYKRLDKIFAQLETNVPEKYRSLEKVNQLGKELREVFGSQKVKGQVCFMDAFPMNIMLEDDSPILCLDILNPHYQEYYQAGEKPPADYLDPVPCFFFTLRRGTVFSFLLHGNDKNLVKKATKWCQAAIREAGIGAKTAAGYGELAVKEQ